MTTVADDVRTWAAIDLDAIRHNIGVVRRRIGSQAEILAVVKAEAYGHGATPVARTLAAETSIFGVANLKEARDVAALGTGRDIMLLSACLPAERHGAVEEKFIVTVSGAEEAAAFADCGPARINFKIDTGMGRIGCSADSALESLRAVRQMRNLSVPECVGGWISRPPHFFGIGNYGGWVNIGQAARAVNFRAGKSPA